MLRASALRRLELRGPARNEALLSILSTESATAGGAAGGAGGVQGADQIDADQIFRHLTATGELSSLHGLETLHQCCRTMCWGQGVGLGCVGGG